MNNKKASSGALSPSLSDAAKLKEAEQVIGTSIWRVEDDDGWEVEISKFRKGLGILKQVREALEEPTNWKSESSSLSVFAKRLRKAKREYFPELEAITPFDSLAYDMERAAEEAATVPTQQQILESVRKEIAAIESTKQAYHCLDCGQLVSLSSYAYHNADHTLKVIYVLQERDLMALEKHASSD